MMGFTGLMPTRDDYLLEKDRSLAKEFVRLNYPLLKLKEAQSFKGVAEALRFMKGSPKAWVVKSDGNLGETIVPSSVDVKVAREQTMDELAAHQKDFAKGGLSVEEFIPEPIEFFPMMVFWDGRPVYSQVELETRMLGGGDLGPQTGGNQNVVVCTELDAKVNQMFFPPAVHSLAKRRKGMFIFDAGILSDGKSYYFMEFAGNRWGWGGVFSELSASAGKNGKMASAYFERLVAGKHPYQHHFGASTAFYSLATDDKHHELAKEGLAITVDSVDDLFLMQVRLGVEGGLESAGYRGYESGPMGYAVGRGANLSEAVEGVHKAVKGVTFKGIYYRTKEDFLSSAYSSAISRRYEFLVGKKLL
jgi:hypothetical protein